MRALAFAISGLTLACTSGCSIIVDSELSGRDADGGPTGETCSTDEQCISFDPFNCNRICATEGRCVDGPMAPDGTRCGMGSMQHCVGGECVMRRCGDGFIDRTATPPEYCDDGNENPDDGCNNLCTRSCEPPAPANCGDDNPCNGEETCMMVIDRMLCRASPRAADGTTCTDSGGADGMCAAGVCVPE